MRVDARHSFSFLVTLNLSGRVPFNVQPWFSKWGKASTLLDSSTKIITLIFIVDYPGYRLTGTLALRSLGLHCYQPYKVYKWQSYTGTHLLVPTCLSFLDLFLSYNFALASAPWGLKTCSTVQVCLFALSFQQFSLSQSNSLVYGNGSVLGLIDGNWIQLKQVNISLIKRESVYGGSADIVSCHLPQCQSHMAMDLCAYWTGMPHIEVLWILLFCLL